MAEEGSTILPGSDAQAQLRFDHPIHTLVGEHLVLREISGEATLGGAVVLDPHPSRRHFRDEDRQAFLIERASDSTDLGLILRSHLERDHFLPITTLSRARLSFAAQIKRALARLTKPTHSSTARKNYLPLHSFW